MANDEKGFQEMRAFATLDYTPFDEEGTVVKRRRVDGIRITLLDSSEQEFRFPEPIYTSERVEIRYTMSNEFIKDSIRDIVATAIYDNFGAWYADGSEPLIEKIMDKLIELGVLKDEKENSQPETPAG